MAKEEFPLYVCGGGLMRGIQILMLEDSEADFELVSRWLRKSGLEFSATRVEKEADFIRELTRTRPDIVLSDHGLPEFDGTRALELTRKLFPETPFIFVAGSQNAPPGLAAHDYVPKARLQDLESSISRALGRKWLKAKRDAEEPGFVAGNHLFECAVEQAKESVMITTAELDPPGPEIIYVNEAFARMTGYTPEEVIGRTPRILQGPKTDRKVLERLKEQLRRGESFEGETFNYRKDGSEFILQWEISPLRTPTGEITHFVSVQRDVTERRQRMEAAEAGRLSRILNRVTDAFVSLDHNWRYTFVNDKAGKIFGRKPEDLIGKHIWTEFPEGTKQPFQKAYEKAMVEQKPAVIEEYYEPWKKWFEKRIYPSSEGLSIFFQDVTEERQRRAELEVSLERFELVTRVTQDVIYDWNIEGQKIRWNQNYYSVFQYDCAEAEHDVQQWAEHLHPQERERVESSLIQALAGSAHFWESEYRYMRGDGTYVDVIDRAFIIRNEAGTPIRMVGSMADVSGQKRQNRILYDTTRKLILILESITDGFISLDREWRFTYVNKQAETLLRRSRETLMGKNLWQEFPEAVGSQFEHEYQRAVRDRVTVKFEVFYPELQTWLFVAAYPSPEGLSIYFNDITTRKHAREEIERLNAELEERVLQRTAELQAANQELEAFCYSVSHDLQAPLRHIVAFGEMLGETAASKLDEEETEYLETIQRSAEKMSSLITDLLSFSRMLRTELANEPVRLREILDDAIRDFTLEMRGREVRLEIGELPVVYGDQSMLQQVMTNLFSNALKYTRVRKVAEIQIGSRENEKELVIFFKDNGVGFDPERAHRLFGVFQRLHNEIEFEGTGIGLANVRRIIERHGGRVWAESGPGEGATFYFSLPAARKAVIFVPKES